MFFKYLTFLLGFALAGSHLNQPILESFERDIVAGDINSLQSHIETHLNLIQSPAANLKRDKLFLLAVLKHQTDVVDLLLKKIVFDAASNNNVAIRTAALNGDADIVKLLLERPEVNPGANDNEALIMAAKDGHTEVVRQLLESPKVDPNARSSQALFWASTLNHPDIVKLFILHERIDPLFFRLYSLEKALLFESVDLVRFLISQPFFSQHRVLIDKIIETGDLRQIRTLVDAGYEIDAETLKSSLKNGRLYHKDDVVEYLEFLKAKQLVSA